MDFTNRNTQPQTFAPGPQSGSPDSEPASNKNRDKEKRHEKLSSPTWQRYAGLVLGLVVVLLVVAVAALTFTSKPDSQAKYIDSGKLQAVFLNTGQVYFGNITKVTPDYFVLGNIYYLQSNSSDTTATASTSGSNVSLVKLGCELHRPYDTMVINRDQVTFWENLKDGGQVATAVKKFKSDNPKGQTCSDTTPSSTSNVQGSTQTTPSATTKKP